MEIGPKLDHSSFAFRQEDISLGKVLQLAKLGRTGMESASFRALPFSVSKVCGQVYRMRGRVDTG